jgi:hypothetical protein
MRSATRTIPAAALVLGLAIGAGCGGGALPQSPGAVRGVEKAAEPEPATVEEAQAQIDRARAALAGAPAEPSTSAVTEAPSKAETPDTAADERRSCAAACRAIASMRRAVEALCRMTGATDARCTDARKTLSDSEARVARCGC